MTRRKALYEGKTKTIYEGIEPDTLIQYFKDDVTVENGGKSEIASGKGVLNNRISSHIMAKLEGIGVFTHFMRSLNMREQLVRPVDMIPIQVVVRNFAAGSMCSRLGVEEGQPCYQPLVELYYKDDSLNNPIISEQHVFAFGLADPDELDEMMAQALRVNDFMTGLFSAVGLRLIDIKLEFGCHWDEEDDLYIVLADEISPDNCRIWDAETGESLGRDRLAQGLDLIEGYQEIAKRLGLVPKSGIIQGGNIDEKIVESLDRIESKPGKKRRLRSVKKSSKPR